ncbi:MAG: pitrilysin family protein [Archangium sp.]|nr:pitrilysin family protein [Archangium sp.]MDP3569110.1 pitrilysin family protein [Archangium sp.]
MTARYRLPNGLTVVLEQQRHAPVVAFQVWVKVGSADESPEEVGLAHLHEHMLFKGTGRRGLGEIARSIEAHGGEINAWTSFDQTVYHVVMASRHARQGLDVLADAVRNSSFDAAELTREIEVVCEEIKRSLDMPGRRASKTLFGEAFKTHPYGRPVIGFEADVRAHTRERVLAFYGKHYQPSNMVLSAVGDFDEATLRTQVDELFGGEWARAPRPAFHRAAEPDFSGVRVVLQRDDVKDAHLHLAFQIPGVEHRDTAALDVLAMLLGQGDASRLSLEVRRKRSLARDVNAWAWTPRERGLFAASLTTTPATLSEAFEETVRVMATLTRVEAEPDEVETIKALIEAEAVYQRETVQGLARKLGYYESMAGGLEREASYYEAISQVTARQLREVADTYFTFDRAVVTGLLPHETQLSEQRVREVLTHVAANRPATLPARTLAAPTPLRLVGNVRKEKPGTTLHKLDNGATLIVREERAVPLMALRASFHGGVRYETPEESGLTTLLSRTLTRGTSTLGAEAFSHLVDSMAGSLSAIAGRNSMSLRGEFLSKHFDRAFELFADSLQNPAFSDEEFERERTQQLQDIASRDDRPSSLAFELFAKTLWLAHPYRQSTLGEKNTVEQLSPAALRRYHAKWMDPSQMTLAVVGDVDTEVVLERARAALGGTRGGAAAAPTVAPEPAWTGPRESRRTLQKAQTHLVLGFPGARMTDPWRRGLEVMQTLLSGQSGRLFLELRDKRSMAYSVSAMLMEGIDPGSFSIYMGTSPEKVEAALAGIRAELEKLQVDLVTDAELSRAKEHLIGTQGIGLQRNGARAGVMALDACYGLGAEAFLRYPEEIAAVTAEDIRSAAQRVIDFQRQALAVVGP